jgi:hypothetical protein
LVEYYIDQLVDVSFHPTPVTQNSNKFVKVNVDCFENEPRFVNEINSCTWF